MARRLATILTVDDIVRERKSRGLARGTSRSAVVRWLKALDQKSRGRVILRRGRLVYTTLSLLMRADPRWLEETEISKDEVLDLKRRLAEHVRKTQAIGGRLRDVQAIVEVLAAKVEALERGARAGS